MVGKVYRKVHKLRHICATIRTHGIVSRAEEDESEVAEEAGNKSGAAGQEQQTNNQPETERRCQRGICATITIRLAQLREIATDLREDFTLTENVSRLKVPTCASKFKTLCWMGIEMKLWRQWKGQGWETGRLVSKDLKLLVPYDNCVDVPISQLLTVG